MRLRPFDLFEHGVGTRNAGLPRYQCCNAAWPLYYPPSSIRTPRIVCTRASGRRSRTCRVSSSSTSAMTTNVHRVAPGGGGSVIARGGGAGNDRPDDSVFADGGGDIRQDG